MHACACSCMVKNNQKHLRMSKKVPFSSCTQEAQEEKRTFFTHFWMFLIVLDHVNACASIHLLVEIHNILVLFGLSPKLAHLRTADATFASCFIFRIQWSFTRFCVMAHIFITRYSGHSILDIKRSSLVPAQTILYPEKGQPYESRAWMVIVAQPFWVLGAPIYKNNM